MADAAMKPLQVGLLGMGTVGRGTWDVLRRNEEEIARRAGRPIRITHIATRTLSRAQSATRDVDGVRLDTDPQTVVDDRDIDIVVELIGGIEPAKAYVLRAIANGKHVVTANKALLALHGNEIFAAAQKAGVMVAFEAAVAGGIPIIKALREGLTANRIEWIAGIINGTSNFILSEMRATGATFAAALKDAQAKGYAETDPTFDVDGIDAAHKLTIMSAIAFGVPMQFDKAYTEGDRAHDGRLVRRVDSLDVEGGIGLGIAQALRFGEHHVEGQPLVAHLREDVVAGAVDDPGDPLDAVGRQALADRLDDGNAARHRRLEGDHHAPGVRAREDLGAVLREQRLVGGDDVLAVVDGLQHQLARVRLAADQLHDDVDVRARHDLARARHEFDAVQGDAALLLQVARPGHLDHDVAPGAARDLLAVAPQHLDGAAADSPQAQQADVDGLHFRCKPMGRSDRTCVKWNEVTVMPSRK